MNIPQYLSKLGYQTIDAEYQTHIDSWLSWYQGKTKWHEYSVYNGKKKVQQIRATLGMAKTISEDWADLILNEKVVIKSNEDRFNELLSATLDYNNFGVRGNQLIELAFALGTGAFVEYLDQEGRVVIDYIRANMIFPLSWDNGEITECAFASQRKVDKRLCYYINRHVIENGQYVIYNELIDAETEHQMELPEGLLDVVLTGSDRARFQILMPNICNNIDLDSPMGVSVFANAIDQLKNCDLIFDSYNNEFQLGKKRIMVPQTMTQVAMSEAGTTTPIFDNNDTVFYSLAVGSDSKIDKPVEINMELRADAHEKAINTALSLLSNKCGLGSDRYEYQAGSGLKTATEVISEKSELFQSLKKHEKVIGKALKDLAYTIAEMLGVSTDKLEISIDFDDSIIQDSDAVRQQALIEFNSGLLDEVGYHMRVYNLDQEVAIKKVAEMKARSPAPEVIDFNAESDGEDE